MVAVFPVCQIFAKITFHYIKLYFLQRYIKNQKNAKIRLEKCKLSAKIRLEKCIFILKQVWILAYLPVYYVEK